MPVSVSDAGIFAFGSGFFAAYLYKFQEVGTKQGDGNSLAAASDESSVVR